MPGQFNLKLLNRKYVAKDTMEFGFQVIGEPIEFLPGQHIQLMIPGIYDRNKIEGIHFFSIIGRGNPIKELFITTRISASPFKQYLLSTELSHTFIGFGPLGSFTASQEGRPLVLFALGIGITAMLPIVTIIGSYGKRKLTLFYINGKLEDVAYASELFHLEKQYQSFTLYAYLQNGTLGLPSYRGGKPTDDEIRNSIGSDLADTDVMISGPPKQVYEIRKQIQSLGIPAVHTKVEIYSGYL